MGEFERREMICRCGNVQLEEPPQEVKIAPKILYFDIETAPFRMTLERFDLKLRTGWLDWHNIEKPFFIISWAAAWVNFDGRAERVMSGAVTGYEAKRRSDKRHLKILWELIDQADYVVGHNLKAFDIKKLETRFLLNNLNAPAEFAARDTLTMAKKRFKPESQAMDYWNQLLGGQRKDDMTFEDWIQVTKGNQKIINKMVKYNRGDIVAGIFLLKKFVRYVESNSKMKVFP